MDQEDLKQIVLIRGRGGVYMYSPRPKRHALIEICLLWEFASLFPLLCFNHVFPIHLLRHFVDLVSLGDIALALYKNAL